MGNLFHGPTPFIILFVVLLLFGAPKLPALAKSLGQSMKILKKEVTTSDDDKPVAESPVAETVAAPAATVAAPAAAAVSSVEDELIQAKAETAAAKAEAEALRAAAELRAEGKSEA